LLPGSTAALRLPGGRSEAEQRLRALGYTDVALGVHPDNIVAISLYQNLSFAMWRADTLTTFREHMLDDGSTIREEEPCVVFVKRLAPSGQ
jgi:ribosomal protein S18 acetylase RimI-like enzyme